MNKKTSPSQVKPLVAIAFYSLKAMLRNRATVFFGFAFPLIFISVFGLFGDNGVNLTVGIPDNLQVGPLYKVIASSEAVKIEPGSASDLKKKLEQGRIAAVLSTDDS